MKTKTLTTSVFASGFAIFVFGYSGTAQEMGIPALLKQLETRDTSESAAETIVAKGRQSDRNRTAIANALPSMIDKAWDGPVIDNEILIAGDLQIAECIPELMQHYIQGDEEGFITMSRVERLANDPAGLALAKIGRPVIPEMQRLLGSDNLDLRRKAVRVLRNMHSEAADTVLQQHLAVESDEYVKRLINGGIAQGQAKK